MIGLLDLVVHPLNSGQDLHDIEMTESVAFLEGDVKSILVEHDHNLPDEPLRATANRRAVNSRLLPVRDILRPIAADPSLHSGLRVCHT